MRPATVHLVRHGESTWHVEGRVQGQYAGPGEPVLTTKGEEQARAAGWLLASRLDRPADTLVVTSDQARAVETAHLLAAQLRPGRPSAVRREVAWREQHLGEMEGRLARELSPKPVPDGRDVSEVRWGGGESVQDVHARVAAWLAGAAGLSEVVVVSHEHTIRAAIAALRGRTHREVDWDEPLEPGSVTTVETA